MAYLGTKPANQVIDSTLIADGTITPADLSTGKPVWDTSGNVGIGTSSPLGKLAVTATGQAGFNAGTISSPVRGNLWYETDGTGWKFQIGKYQSSTFTPQMTFTDAGSVGIGTDSPLINSSGKTLHIHADGSNQWSLLHTTNGDTGSGAADGTIFGQVGLEAYVFNYDAGPLIFGTNSILRAVITSNGRFLVGTNSETYSGVTARQTIRYQGGGNEYGLGFRPDADGTVPIWFANAAGSGVGSISTSSTNTSYLTSSDYRLKENIAPMTGALNKVAQLKPCTYTWKSTGESSQGFIAHELQEVVPDAVTGEKDAVNEDGSIKPQGIDTSFLVATLTAAIQELKAELDTVKAELATLKGTA